MAEIKIAGIMRAGIYSPNHIGNDGAIFNLVAEQLRKRGCVVNVYSEEAFANADITEPVVVNMCRDQRSIEKLQQLEEDGAIVVNSGFGIENCARERMTRIFMGSNLPYPPSIIANTNENILDELKAKGFEQCWVKRADVHSMHKEDIAYTRHAEEAVEVLQEFFMRGITKAVINKHLTGTLVKFYGVQGTDFFHFYTNYNAGAASAPAPENRPLDNFDVEQFRQVCERAAQIMDVVVYGGDCIIDTDGSYCIIDFNDWPSFAPVRNEAAPYIARRVLQIVKDRQKARR